MLLRELIKESLYIFKLIINDYLKAKLNDSIVLNLNWRFILYFLVFNIYLLTHEKVSTAVKFRFIFLLIRPPCDGIFEIKPFKTTKRIFCGLLNTL